MWNDYQVKNKGIHIDPVIQNTKFLCTNSFYLTSWLNWETEEKVADRMSENILVPAPFVDECQSESHFCRIFICRITYIRFYFCPIQGFE